MLDFDVALVRLINIVLVLLGILIIYVDELVDDGVSILKPGREVDHQIGPRVFIELHVILICDFVGADARLLVFANIVYIVDRIDNLPQLFLRFVLLANFIFEFLLENRVLRRQIFDLLLQVLHLFLLLVQFILQIVHLVLFADFCLVKLVLQFAFLKTKCKLKWSRNHLEF